MYTVELLPLYPVRPGRTLLKRDQAHITQLAYIEYLLHRHSLCDENIRMAPGGAIWPGVDAFAECSRTFWNGDVWTATEYCGLPQTSALQIPTLR